MVAQIDSRFWKVSLKKSYTRYLSYLLYEGRPLTTRGRWINPIIFFLYRLQAAFPCSRDIEKPIFILGTGRSGTTILGVTLGMHKEVGFLNEPKALWSFLNPNEDLIGSYQAGPASYRLNENHCSESMRKSARRILGYYLRFGLASRVVDKYPELIFRVPFVSALFPDARYLFLYRNGYDTCHSIGSWSKRLGRIEGDEAHDWWGRNDRKWTLLCDQVVSKDNALSPHLARIREYKDHVHRAAVEWIVTMKEGDKLLSKKAFPVMPVQYERYAEDDNYRQEILDFCELTSDSNFSIYTEMVLKRVKPYPPVELPVEIEKEFKSVMERFKYEI